MSDNGPQFSGAEFHGFARSWEFKHVTSSPQFAQSNGKVENAVKMLKRLFIKCKVDSTSEFLALLKWRNTPSEGVEESPAQQLFGWHCKTLLPMMATLLQLRHNHEQEVVNMRKMKAKQEFYYNQKAKPLPALQAGRQGMHMAARSIKQWTKQAVDYCRSGGHGSTLLLPCESRPVTAVQKSSRSAEGSQARRTLSTTTTMATTRREHCARGDS